MSTPVRANPLTPRYRYSPRAGRYIDARGHFVSAQAVRVAVDEVANGASARMQVLSSRLLAGSVSLAAWREDMAHQVAVLHLAQTAAAVGGWARMGHREYGRAGGYIANQLRYLDCFARDVQSGSQPLDGRLLVRTDLYGQAGRVTYERVRAVEAENRGLREERNQLHAADHCPDCLTASALGWQPIGTILPIGSRECRVRDHCTMEYR